MFKILILDSNAAAALDALQEDYDVVSVEPLGFDSQNKYLLVQLATKTTPMTPSSAPLSGSGSATQ